MKDTNIVFWFLVVIALVALWFLLSFCFKDFGEMLINLFNDTKEEITEDPKNEYEEE